VPNVKTKQNDLVKKKIVKQIKSKKQIILPKQKEIRKTNSYDTVILKSTIVVPAFEPKPKPKKHIKKALQSVKLPVKKPEQKIEPKINIHVRSLEDEQSLLKANKDTENFDTTLKLAKYYYKNAKYQKVVFFAKKASRYKPISFEPWYYYAKAKIKENKKDEAIKAIETYLSYFDSNEAQKLLQEIKNKK
jgi:tetratricopeptide (TPR) repeat protein